MSGQDGPDTQLSSGVYDYPDLEGIIRWEGGIAWENRNQVRVHKKKYYESVEIAQQVIDSAPADAQLVLKFDWHVPDEFWTLEAMGKASMEEIDGKMTLRIQRNQIKAIEIVELEDPEDFTLGLHMFFPIDDPLYTGSAANLTVDLPIGSESVEVNLEQARTD